MAAWLPAPGPVLALGATCIVGAAWHVRWWTRAADAGARFPKTTARFLPATIVGFAVAAVLSWREPWRLAALTAMLTGATALRRLYRRRGPHRQPCVMCPERLVQPTCSGFLPMYQRELAFQRMAQRLIRKRR